MFNKKEADVTFISKIPGLTRLEDCMPKPTARYTPDWWKEKKIDVAKQSAYDLNTGNIKHCPSFTDVFTSGYVVPMWMDTYLGYDKETGRGGAMSNLTKIDHHPCPSEDMESYTFLGKEAVAFFKAGSPWSILTKPGVSVLILPLFFNFDPDFSIVPGIIDTEYINHLNPDIIYHSKEKEIFIERGTPLFQVIPFRKEKFTFDVKEIDDLSDKSKNKFYANVLDHETRLRGTNFYINKRKQGQK
jgi:hypothetical protein